MTRMANKAPRVASKCQTETRPPRRYSRISNEEVMEEVKGSVRDEAGDHEPKTSFEADDRKNQESDGDYTFHDEYSRGSSHHGKQRIV